MVVHEAGSLKCAIMLSFRSTVVIGTAISNDLKLGDQQNAEVVEALGIRNDC